ncbi:uncharacterized protein LOC134727149 [Mytilus trossulus]|uniref:uncharacterized protein LOC134727149 n=1 Tax=Mytilus trossulus TaxID=6551 RepID=UPI003007C2C9
MWKELFFLLVVTTSLVASVKVQCKQDSQCGSDECCYYHEGPMVASKRRRAVLPFTGMVQGGWCEKYKTRGEYCDTIEMMNGHCECAPGLKCTFISDQHVTPQPIVQKRGPVFGGHYECQT